VSYNLPTLTTPVYTKTERQAQKGNGPFSGFPRITEGQLDVRGSVCYTENASFEPWIGLAGGMMYKVKGVYDGKKVVLLEPLPVPAHTSVEVSVTGESLDLEQVYWQQLVELGLIAEVRPLPLDEEPFSPVRATGKPVSEAIIEERR
jgi:hypothetical protein